MIWYFIVFIVGIILGAAVGWFAMRKYKTRINELLDTAKIREEVQE